MRIDEITRRNFIGGLGALAIPGVSLAGNDAPKFKHTDNALSAPRDVQRAVFEWVANAKKIKIDPSIPPPKIVDFWKIDRKIFMQTWGQMPDESRPAPHTYHWVQNLVIIGPTTQLHSLAHEFVHYFQYMYDVKKDYDRMRWDGISTDWAETEAITLQGEFKKAFP